MTMWYGAVTANALLPTHRLLPEAGQAYDRLQPRRIAALRPRRRAQRALVRGRTDGMPPPYSVSTHEASHLEPMRGKLDSSPRSCNL